MGREERKELVNHPLWLVVAPCLKATSRYSRVEWIHVAYASNPTMDKFIHGRGSRKFHLQGVTSAPGRNDHSQMTKKTKLLSPFPQRASKQKLSGTKLPEYILKTSCKHLKYPTVQIADCIDSTCCPNTMDIVDRWALTLEDEDATELILKNR